jgi:hypothetical protein
MTLKRHRKRQLGERMRLADTWEDHGLVFPHKVGKSKNAKALISRSFKPILERVQVFPAPCAYITSDTPALPCCSAK